MDIVIGVEHLRKTYGHLVAVDDIGLEVQRGEIFGLLGRNGAGKTTTVECLQGLRLPDSGSMSVLGLDPATESRALRRRIGSQLQESGLPDRMRVGEALSLFSSLTPGGPDWRDVMAEWDLADKAGSAFGALSGGQRQRLLVALALVNHPELVFLDEMTTGLDPAARRVAWDLIERIHQRGTTIILVTHFMEEAERLCDRLAIVDAGRVIALGTPAAIVSASAGPSRVLFSADPGDPGDLGWLGQVPGVGSVEWTNGRVSVTGTGPLLVRVGAALWAHGLEPLDLRTERPTLEDAFLRLTGSNVES
ncbi:MAG: multidrug ABC transporter ATP-binding protein [Chloroflexi bacterium RBG_16_69_14]|nr:MAG: multidrug ABC transporter ATP-binding protein [Chloroflexi bacterium RBG_16_69_14]